MKLQFKSLIVLFLASSGILATLPKNSNGQNKTKGGKLISVVPAVKMKSRDVCKKTGDVIWDLLEGPYKKTAAFLTSEARISMLSEYKHSLGTCSNEELVERLEYATKTCLNIYVNALNNIYISKINYVNVTSENQRLNSYLTEDYNEYISVSYFYQKYTDFIAWNMHNFTSELVR